MGNPICHGIKNCPSFIWQGGLVFALLVSCFIGLLMGYTPLTAGEVTGVLFSSGNETAASEILWSLRLPRILLSLSSGMGLALSGVIMQALFRNPMSSPYIMGISSGASLGVVAVVFLGLGTTFLGSAAMGLGAFAGALLLSLCVIAAAGKRSGDTTYLLILGVAMSAVCGGVTGVLIYCGAASSGTDVSMYWLMGSVSFAKPGPSLALFILVLCMTLFFLTQSRILNLMLLGREGTLPLGRDLKPFFKLYLLLNAILVGAIVMEAGLIGFVGLIVPHFVRLLLGSNHKVVVPASVLLGGLLTVWADILGRTIIHGIEFPIGVMLAVIGAPLFLVMLVETAGKRGVRG